MSDCYYQCKGAYQWNGEGFVAKAGNQPDGKGREFVKIRFYEKNN